jgi:inner membrane protein
MMFKTHLAFAFYVGLLAIGLFDIEHKFVFLVALLFASALPDIDMPESKMGRKSKPVSWILNFLFGHRGLIHTIWVPIGIFILFTYLDLQVLANALSLGFLSHLAIEILTVQGIRPFWPLGLKLRGFVKTGGLMEYAILVGIVILIFFELDVLL